ncbi:glucanase [Thozetella sp. PMI_491]|nr:glucanase [Thozetella sp. PMI_491]
MATGFLKAQGTRIVDENGDLVILRGAGLGGWMNMENFLIGYPGHEAHLRTEMASVLGPKKAAYFFDRFLYHFYTEDDARFFKSLGLNSLRVPFNYRHLEDDLNPRVIKEEGFKHIDRVVDLCSKEGIYTILDMHTVPGGQNPDWHSDNPTSYAAFWEYKDHQDRTIWLWEQIAGRYKDNPWVAGYNPINEPCDPHYTRLPTFYKRLEKAIRAIDPNHILWLDGNTFAMEWQGFDEVLPNCAYSIHDYSKMGFPVGQLYEGTQEQKDKLAANFSRKCEFHTKNGVPIWNGEFGPVYSNERDPDAEKTNACRYNLLGEQLRIYEKAQIPWCIWLYKDIGIQGMLYTSAESPWLKLVGPFIKKKDSLQLDAVVMYPTPLLDEVLDPVVHWIDSVSPTATHTYPPNWDTRRHIERSVINCFLAGSFVREFAELFRDKSEAELDELARSFSFEQCVQRHGLNKIMSDHAKSVQKTNSPRS